ncbi:MAG TPA: hypothetical protein DCZ11_09895 [Gammaproteobacteria bacterium]|nr:hypothetical protein [Gammaproteobacteria bacterium]MCH78743.1 hypothetical protein [Gammaproteobacteria bacterium]
MNEAKRSESAASAGWADLTSSQRHALELMQTPGRELYQTCERYWCGITFSAGERFRGLPLEQAEDLERRGLIEPKWPHDNKVKWWVLAPNENSSADPAE